MSFSELQDRSPEAAEHGDADFYVFQTDLLARYGLTDRTEIFLALPFKASVLRVDDDDEHHRDQTFQGLGDIRLGGKHFLVAEKSIQLAGTLGLRFPTGRLNRVTAASYLDHDEAAGLGITVPEHSHLQLGTGTFDPFAGVEALYRFDENCMLFASVDVTVPLYENRYNYRTSPSVTMILGPAINVEGEGSNFFFGLFGELFYAGRDRFEGRDIVGPGGSLSGTFGVPNTGRFELALKPTITWRISETITLDLQARVPVYTSISEDSERGDVQLTEPVGASMGLTLRF